jgi:hypothetical protein
MPSPTEKDCLKVVIVEGGTIKELADELMAKIGNRRLPPNSLILLYSASCLAEIGTAAYTKELLHACHQGHPGQVRESYENFAATTDFRCGM